MRADRRAGGRRQPLYRRGRAALVAVDYEVLPAIERLPRRARSPARRRAHSDLARQSRLAYPDGLWRRRCGLRRRRARLRGGILAASRRRHEPRRPARCWRATSRRATCSPCGRRPRRRISAAACSPICSTRNLETDPHDRARRRRRLRPEGAVLRRGGRDPGARRCSSAGRSNGSRTGASISCAPRRSATSTGTSRSRSTPTARSSACAARMLHDTGAFVPWGIIMPYIAAVDGAGTLCGSELSARHDGRAHQQGRDHAGARRRPAAGGVRDGAADGPRGARARSSIAPSCAGAT